MILPVVFVFIKEAEGVAGGPLGNLAVDPWPTSSTAAELKGRASARAKKTLSKLLRLHLGRQVAAGWRGATAMGALFFVSWRIVSAAVARTALRLVMRSLPAPVAAAGASAVAFLTVNAMPGTVLAVGAAAAAAVMAFRWPRNQDRQTPPQTS